MSASRHIPPELADLVVTQAWDAYTVEDHAVWRFVVQHTHARLVRTAHDAYRAGFVAAGIETGQIPRIAHMNDRLADLGWSAVCVDGFIPPRAFFAFQAQRVLPIAADIRTRKHLSYTPAPDIVHEAAGHAPFLGEPSYAAFLTQIGEVGARAFSTPADHAIYAAIFALSEVKEDPSSTPAQVTRAEQRLRAALAAQGEPSEAALLARLYWWTVEYGLIGALSAPKLYGAGLLSSIGEGYFCDDPAVHKLPLSAACIDVSYDITRPQPQLFVAEDFAQLSSVLGDVAAGLSAQRGGLDGLKQAARSDDIASIALDAGVQVSGQVHELLVAELSSSCVQLEQACVHRADGTVALQVPALFLLLGPRADGREAAARSKLGALVELRLAPGEWVRGPLRRRVALGADSFACELSEARAHLGGRERLIPQSSWWLVAGEARSVSACADTSAVPASQSSRRARSNPSVRVPRARVRNAQDAEILSLFERAHAALAELGGRAAALVLEGIATQLSLAHPDEWLLRYELLAALIMLGEGLGEGQTTVQGLIADLERLEIRYAHREPIATGLAHLRALGARATDAPKTIETEAP